MSGLNPKFIVSPSLQDYLIDKDTGFPLSGGVLNFWSDVNRTMRKNVFTLTGSPPGYTYTILPNPLTLSSTGTPVDGSGNNVALYYYPYEGTPSENSNVIEQYYITWTSAVPFSVAQAIRQAWPNFTSQAGGAGVDFVNYIPDGQFLIHTNILATDTIVEGEITTPITQLSQGGWTFERPSGSTATDLVTFSRYPNVGDSSTDIPSENPRYAVQINCQTPGSDAFKDLRIKFNDVNKFCSDTQQFTFSFSAQTVLSSDVVVSLIIIKNFGTGGDSTLEIPVSTFTITSDYSLFQRAIIFQSNAGFNIGPNDDDFIQLALRFPNQGFKAAFTDFILTDGAVTITGFPPTTNSDFMTRTVSGWLDIPNHDGSSLYLYPMLTPQGMKFDDSLIGTVFAQTRDDIPVGYLEMDDKQYITSNTSSDGVPYSRLGNKWFNQTTLLPKFSGKDFATQYKSSINNAVGFLHNNTAGSVSATADGSTATGFTFTTIHSGDTEILMNTYWSSRNTEGPIYIILETQFPGTPTAAQDVTIGSPFVANSYRNGTDVETDDDRLDSGSIQYSYVRMADASVLLAAAADPGKYWTFSTIDGTPITPVVADYYVWYSHNGEQIDPAPVGRTGIEVKLDTADTTSMCAQKTVWALDQVEVTKILYKAASTIPQNAFFTFSTRVRSPSASKNYYVWYSKDGVTGTDPAPGGTGINVPITTGDTDDGINLITQAYINKYAFGVPDTRGFFLRGVDSTFSVDQSIRFSSSDGTFTGATGTFEFDDVLDHIHAQGTEEYMAGAMQSIAYSSTANSGTPNANTFTTGIYEGRPKNFAVKWLVKY